MRSPVHRFPCATLLVLGLLAVKPVNAFTVIDPTNLVQNTLTAVRTLDMANNQVRQLQNETQMLLNQARHLQRLDYNVVSQLRASLANTERLLAEARGLAYEVQRLDQEFSRLYPNEYSSDASSQRLAEEARERWQQGLDGLHTALRVQAQVTQNLAEDESALAALVQQSQSAGGALQAAQATNQLLALQAKQSIQAQQLQITQNRAVALELARQAAAAEEARERRRRFMGNGTPYTPYPVQFYRQGGALMRFLTLLPLLVLVACGQVDNGVMARQDDATERFYSGCARPGEFLRPTDLPAIPPSFDEDAQ